MTFAPLGLTVLVATWSVACAPASAGPPATPPQAGVPPAQAASVPVGVSTGGSLSSSAPVVAPPPTPKAPTTATEVLTAGRAPLDACYALARKTNPNLGHTNVQITFSMDNAGKLQSVELTYRNRMDDSAKDCMKAAAEALKFPPSLTGQQVGTIEFTPP